MRIQLGQHDRATILTKVDGSDWSSEELRAITKALGTEAYWEESRLRDTINRDIVVIAGRHEIQSFHGVIDPRNVKHETIKGPITVFVRPVD